MQPDILKVQVITVEWCIANFDSGNHAYELCRILERKGYVFEVVSTPCHIARDGCGYSMRLPLSHAHLLIEEGLAHGIPVREIYRIVSGYTRRRYEKIYQNYK